MARCAREILNFSIFSRVFPFAVALSCHPLIAPDCHFQDLSSCSFLSWAVLCMQTILSLGNAILTHHNNTASWRCFTWRFHPTGHRPFSAVAARPKIPAKSLSFGQDSRHQWTLSSRKVFIWSGLINTPDSHTSFPTKSRTEISPRGI